MNSLMSLLHLVELLNKVGFKALDAPCPVRLSVQLITLQLREVLEAQAELIRWLEVSGLELLAGAES